ncbi:MAG: 50S ribosomal protein L11 methyltransferase [Candidatus Lindowbacteria bacterium]|nr:50S ribosomal protein L11 methyltransferase [Candidatus Lindowbacteria bacterium]
MAENYIVVTLPDTDDIHLLLSESPTLGYETKDSKIICYFNDGEDISFLDGIKNAQIENIPGIDWNKKWQQELKPVNIGTICISPPWDTKEGTHKNPKQLEIIMVPGQAFGTGTHETTRSCLAMLQEYLQTGALVLDYGCGSGILGISADLMGASTVLCIDYEDAAVKLATKNAKQNNASSTKVIQSDEPPDSGTFDIILANIQSSVLMPFLDRFKNLLAKDGTLILSGLLYEENLKFAGTKRIIRQGEWATYAVSAK